MLTHLGPDTSGEAVAALLRRDGAVIVDELAPPEQLDALFAELTPHMEATPFGPDDFSGRRTRRTGGLLARSAAARDLVMHPLVHDVVPRILDGGAGYRLHLTQVIAIGPDSPAQSIHRDQWAFDFFPFPRGYEAQVNTIWAGDDFTEANGATRVVPGSHLADDGLRFEPHETVPAEMARGSVLFYTGAVYHGGGANGTDRWRRAVNLTYARSFLRQEENQYLTVPLETARTFPVELQKLMGYARGAYALGYVDDLRDPLEVLRPGGAPGTRAGF